MKKKQNGRSMIEMLGVLVLIGVLSVAALFGFTYAMNKHRANETIHDVMLRAANVPMTDEFYQTRPTGYAFKFPDLQNELSTMGYTLNTLKNAEYGYVYKVEALAIPRRVCNLILRLEPTDIDEIRIGENKEVYTRGAWDLCTTHADASEQTLMTFYFEKHCTSDSDCSSCQECFQGRCHANYDLPGCGTVEQCPTAPVCSYCQIKLYDNRGCHIGCQDTRCCPAPDCAPEDVFDAEKCICQDPNCPEVDAVCGTCEIKIYDSNNCFVGCQDTSSSCCPAPNCEPGEVFDADKCICQDPNCPEVNEVCETNEIKLYDEEGCFAGCQITSCNPAPHCEPGDVFDEVSCTCQGEGCDPFAGCAACEVVVRNDQGCPVGCEPKSCTACSEGYVEIGQDECGCPLCQSEECPDPGSNSGCAELVEDTASVPGTVCYTWGSDQTTTKQTGACCDEGTVSCCPLTEDCSCEADPSCDECTCPDPGEAPCAEASLESYSYTCKNGDTLSCQRWNPSGCVCESNADCGSCSQCVNGTCGPDETTTKEIGECCDGIENCCPWKGECERCVPASCEDVVDTVPPGEEACYETVSEMCGQSCSGYRKVCPDGDTCPSGSRQVGSDSCGCPVCEPCETDQFSCGSECCVAANQFCCGGDSCCAVGHACCGGECCSEGQTCGNGGVCCDPLSSPCGECEIEGTDANGCPTCVADPDCCTCPEPGEEPCTGAVLEDYTYTCSDDLTLVCQQWNTDECVCETADDCGTCYECLDGICVFQEGYLVCENECCDTETHFCCGETCCPTGQDCCDGICCGENEMCGDNGCEPKGSPCPEGLAPVRPGAANAFDSGEKADDTGIAIWCCNEGYASVHKCRGNFSDCLRPFTWRGIRWYEEEKCCQDWTEYGGDGTFAHANIMLAYGASEPECCYSSDHLDVIGWANHEACCPDRGYPYYTGSGGVSCHTVKREIKIVQGHPEDTIEDE